MTELERANARLRAASTAPAVQIEVFAKEQWTPSLLDELHAMAITMADEAREHFETHARTNDAVHLFRDQLDGTVVGFQFWRSAPGPAPGLRVVIGGKLRVRPAFRRRALHLLAARVHYDTVARAHPAAQIHRLSIASVFGFVSIAQTLADYQFVAERAPLASDRAAHARALGPNDRWLCDAIAETAAASGYGFDPASGLVDVRIRLTEAQLASYPPSYFERPHARAYLARNPGFRSNGCYLAFAFALSSANLAAIDAAIDRRLASR